MDDTEAATTAAEEGDSLPEQYAVWCKEYLITLGADNARKKITILLQKAHIMLEYSA